MAHIAVHADVQSGFACRLDSVHSVCVSAGVELDLIARAWASIELPSRGPRTVFLTSAGHRGSLPTTLDCVDACGWVLLAVCVLEGRAFNRRQRVADNCLADSIARARARRGCHIGNVTVRAGCASQARAPGECGDSIVLTFARVCAWAGVRAFRKRITIICRSNSTRIGLD